MSKIAVIGISGESIFMKLDSLPTPSVTSHAKNCHIFILSLKSCFMNISYIKRANILFAL